MYLQSAVQFGHPSHSSPVSSMLFPHICDGVICAPSSRLHSALQPSPFSLFPSSHCSPTPSCPSPHSVISSHLSVFSIVNVSTIAIVFPSSSMADIIALYIQGAA